MITLSKTEVGTRDWGFDVIELTGLLFGGMWIWVLWIKTGMECFQWGLMGHSCRNRKTVMLVMI